MTRQTALILLSTSLVLPACVIDHDLGATADEGTSGSGPDDSTGPDPSATSGQTTGPDDSTGSAEVTTSPGNPTGTADTQTDTGEPGDCEQGELWVQWAETSPEPMPGIDATFAAVLSGDCTLSGMFSGSAGEGQPNLWELYLDCTLSGRIDGDDQVADQAFMPTIAGTSAIPAEQWLPFLDEQPLQLRVVLDHWGMGWSRYLVLERGSTVVLDMVAGEHIDPLDGVNWTDDIMQLLEGQPWHGPLFVDTHDPSCGQGIGKCGQVPRVLEVGWAGEGGDAIGLHGGEDDFFDTTVPDLWYHASVTSARDISMPLCTDMPLGDYRYSIWEGPKL